MSVNRYEEALKALEENLSLDPQDLSVLFLTAQFHHGLYQSEKALDILGPLFEYYSKYREKLVTQEIYSIYFGILISLGKVREIKEFKDPQDTWNYGILTHFFLNNHQSRAFAHYVLREFEEAEAILQNLKTVEWENYFTGGWTRKFHWYTRLWVEGFLGSTLARQGRTEEALAQVEYLESMRINQPNMTYRLKKGSISYYPARIYAILGMKQEAVEALNRSIQEGKMYEFRSFDQDWDLAALGDFQPYRDLIDQK